MHYSIRSFSIHVLARLTLLTFTIAFLSLAGPSLNASDDDKNKPIPSGEDFWEKYDDLTDWLTLRLKLTPEQEKIVLPILHKNFKEKKKLLKKYGFRKDNIPALTRKEVEEIDAKIIGIRAATRAKLVPILNAQQLEELKKIQEEYHMAFREQLGELKKREPGD